jgi:hypothetical protein
MKTIKLEGSPEWTKVADWNYVYDRYLDMWALWADNYWYYITRHF